MWTIPNLLTFARIAAAPALGLMVALGGRDWAALAFVLFVAAALTDYLDGWLARRLDQLSLLGKMLDPIADKAMVIVVLAALMTRLGADWVFLIPAIVILLREVLVAGLREFLGAVKLDVTRLAKWKTTAQLVAIGALLGAELLPPLGAGLDAALAGLALLWIAAALTAASGWDYFRKGLAYIRRKDEGV